jgi:hypothetical protein
MKVTENRSCFVGDGGGCLIALIEATKAVNQVRGVSATTQPVDEFERADTERLEGNN